MKVLGQLEQAQLEQLAGDPASAPTGRVYANITNPLNAIAKFFNGTAWRPFRLGQDLATIVQSSGKFVTVNWANGLNQQVNLTDNCRISFSNPVEGEVHTLIVKQVAADQIAYSYVLNMPDQEINRKGAFQPSVPAIRSQNVHQWFYKAAFKAAATTVPSSTTFAVANIPPTTVSGLDVARDNSGVAYGRTNSPFWISNNLTDKGANGFRLNQYHITTPTAAAAQANGPRISPDMGMIAVPSLTTPFIQMMSVWGVGSGTGAYWANPGTLPLGGANGCAWHPTSMYLATAHVSSPFMSIYPITGSAFGTKIADPAALPAGIARSIEFAPTGDYIAVSNATTPFIEVWPFNHLTGAIGAKVANPSSLPVAAPVNAQGARTIAWRPQADYIAVTTNATTPFIYVVPFDRSTGSYGTPVTVTGAAIPPGTCQSVSWSRCGTYLIVGCNTTPFVLVYDFSSFTLGAPMTLSSAVAIGATTIIDLLTTHDNEQLLIGTALSPFMWQLQMPNPVKNYVRLI